MEYGIFQEKEKVMDYGILVEKIGSVDYLALGLVGL